MYDIKKIATTYWKAINGLKVSESEFLEAISEELEGSGRGFCYQPTIASSLILKALADQPANTELTERWRSHLSGTKQPDEHQARQFIHEVISSAADVDSILVHPIHTGETIMESGHIFDGAIRRVLSRKKGWSLHLTTKGRASYNCIRQQLSCSPGDLVLISPNGMYDYQRHADSRQWTHRWIYFTHEESWMRWLRWREVGPGIYHLKATGKDYNTLHTLFLECIGVFEREEVGAPDLLRNLTEQILIRCFHMQASGDAPDMPDKILQVSRYITDHFSEEFDLQLLANFVGMSRSRLSALFREHTGTSIMRWRDELRMSKACELLSSTTAPINRIAEQVGYSDPLYFSRTFGQHLGCNPRDYRKSKIGFGSV